MPGGSDWRLVKNDEAQLTRGSEAQGSPLVDKGDRGRAMAEKIPNPNLVLKN
jgi:hypothetical protein